MDEKLNIKLTEQNIFNSEQYNELEKKLDKLSNQITQVNSMIVNNNDLTEKINDFKIFKSKAEDKFNRLNSKISSIQKETKDYINNIEKIINDNLRYPGVIGSNGKFLNFRHFIDYIIRTFKDFHQFKEEIRNLDFNNFKKEINSDIQNFRFAINDNNRNSLRLIVNNFKEFDSKINDLIEENKKIMSETEEKFDIFKNKINDSFLEYQNKFIILENNINAKKMEQLNEIENFKIIRNNIIQEMKIIKYNLEISKKNKEPKDVKRETNYRMKKINNGFMQENSKNMDENNQNNEDNNTINIKNIYQIMSNKKRRNTFIFNKYLLNDEDEKGLNPFIIKDNNFLGVFKNRDEKKHLSLNKRMNFHQIYRRTNSFEKTQKIIKLRNYYFNEENTDLSNSKKKGNISISNEYIKNNKERENIQNIEMKKKTEKKDSSIYVNFQKNDDNNLNYSIASVSNMPNIKIKKVILPEYINNKNKNKTSRSLISDKKEIKRIQNNLSSTNSRKFFFNKDGNNKTGRNFFNMSKINRHKEKKINIVNMMNRQEVFIEKLRIK